jgi:hypothetical protein
MSQTASKSIPPRREVAQSFSQNARSQRRMVSSRFAGRHLHRHLGYARWINKWATILNWGLTMSSSSATASSTSPLDAAQKIVADLDGMTRENQCLAVKFAIETLGLQLAAAPVSTLSPQGNTPSRAPLASPEHSTNIRTFVESKSPKTDQQFAAVVAYFYQFEAPPQQRRESIDVQIMKDAARLANWPQPPNWRFTLTNAKNAGILNAAGEGGYTLSPVGENLVAITLPGAGIIANGKKGETPKKGKKKKAKKAG